MFTSVELKKKKKGSVVKAVPVKMASQNLTCQVLNVLYLEAGFIHCSGVQTSVL